LLQKMSAILSECLLNPSSLTKFVMSCAAGIQTRVSCHTLRHSFAPHLPKDGYDIRTIQELLGHRDVKTTMVYTHVLNRGGRGDRSPLNTQPNCNAGLQFANLRIDKDTSMPVSLLTKVV